MREGRDSSWTDEQRPCLRPLGQRLLHHSGRGRPRNPRRGQPPLLKFLKRSSDRGLEQPPLASRGGDLLRMVGPPRYTGDVPSVGLPRVRVEAPPEVVRVPLRQVTEVVSSFLPGGYTWRSGPRAFIRFVVRSSEGSARTPGVARSSRVTNLGSAGDIDPSLHPNGPAEREVDPVRNESPPMIGEIVPRVEWQDSGLPRAGSVDG